MKYFLLLFFVYAVSYCFASPSSSFLTTFSENKSGDRDMILVDDELVEIVNKHCESFTGFDQDILVRGSIHRIVTCIEEHGLLEGVKKWMTFTLKKMGLPLEERKMICKKYANFFDGIYRCVKRDFTPFTKDYNDALVTFVNLNFKLFCKVDDMIKFLLMFEETAAVRIFTPKERVFINQYVLLVRNKISSTEANYCLLIGAAEAIMNYHVKLLFKGRKLPFNYRSDVFVATKAVFDFAGRLPMKTFEECS